MAGLHISSNYQTYLSPLNTKTAPFSPKFSLVKPTDSILSISFILHIDKSKSYKTRMLTNQEKNSYNPEEASSWVMHPLIETLYIMRKSHLI
jgi:hypothetical protein